MEESKNSGNSRVQLEKMIDRSPAIIATVDEEGRFLEVSAATEDILGYAPEELYGKKIFNFIFREDVNRTRKVVAKIKEGREVHDFENRYIHKENGRKVPVEWAARWDDEDELIYAVGRDTTDVKETEKDLAQERNMLRAIIDNLPDYIFVKNKDRELIVSNERVYREIVGADKEEEALGKTAYDLFDPEIAQSIDEDDKYVIENEASISDREEMVFDNNGNKLFLRTTRVPLYDDNGNVTGLVGISHDITEQKKANDQIRLERERYDMVVRATQDAIYDWDITSNNLHWDESFKSTFGYDPDREKYTIEQWAENVHPDDLEETKQSLVETLNDSSQTEWEAEYRFLKRDGTYALILERGFITRNETGEATRMIGALQDITDLKRKEQELEESLEEKETLLAEIHHRVKNNLAVVSGMIQLQAFDEENEHFVEKLSDSITRIHSMASIHEQLYQSNSFSKLNFSENLKELVSSIIQTISVRSEIDIVFDVEPVQLSVTQAIPCSLIINEVVTNILKHGFQETKEGKIEFNLSKTETQVQLVVKDNGDGLPDNFQCQKSNSLGLHLIQKLSEQLDASYGYESLDDGAMFSLTFEKSEIKSTYI